MSKFGQLYIVATPIGNLRDITLRALDILKQVDLIAAEDTRHSKTLLQHYQINTPLISLHEHNEQQRSQELAAQLQAGKCLALISDAGTPLISDPGYQLVRTVREAGITVTPIPGACAVTAALSVSGLPTDRFCFEGFLPAKASMRQQYLATLLTESRTLIFYESPHRILDTLKDMAAVFTEPRRAVIARELTKTFETVLSGSLAELVQQLTADKNQQKGEFVILLAGNSAAATNSNDESRRILQILLTDLPVKQAAQLAAQITGEKKNALYAMALAMAADKNRPF